MSNETMKDKILGNVYEYFEVFPKAMWTWDIFGHGELVCSIYKDTGLWHRTITRIFFRSKWTRVCGKGE